MNKVTKLPGDIGAIHFVGIGGIGMSGIAEVLLDHLHMGQFLTRVGDGFHVDHRHCGILGKGLDHQILAVLLPIDKFGKGSNTNQIAITRQYLGGFGNMFFGHAIHDFTKFKR